MPKFLSHAFKSLGEVSGTLLRKMEEVDDASSGYYIANHSNGTSNLLHSASKTKCSTGSNIGYTAKQSYFVFSNLKWL